MKNNFVINKFNSENTKTSELRYESCETAAASTAKRPRSKRRLRGPAQKRQTPMRSD